MYVNGRFFFTCRWKSLHAEDDFSNEIFFFFIKWLLKIQSSIFGASEFKINKVKLKNSPNSDIQCRSIWRCTVQTQKKKRCCLSMGLFLVKSKHCTFWSDLRWCKSSTSTVRSCVFLLIFSSSSSISTRNTQGVE